MLEATHEVLTVDLTCEIVPGGLTVTLHDDGPPFDPSRAGDADAFVRGLLEEGSADWVEFRNEGRGGKTVRMMFHHRDGRTADEGDRRRGRRRGARERRPRRLGAPRRGRRAAVGAGPGGRRRRRRRRGGDRPAASRCSLMRPEQAGSVSDCIFDTYRLTYLHEDMYHPLRIAELNESGAMISVVATAPDGTVVGHFALSFPDEARDVPELGIAATRRAWRGQHVARRLADLLMEEAAARGLYGVFAEAITVHPFTQHLNVQLGMGTCGVRLATIPADREFRGMDAQSRHRQLVRHHVPLLRRALDGAAGGPGAAPRHDRAPLRVDRRAGQAGRLSAGRPGRAARRPRGRRASPCG